MKAGNLRFAICDLRLVKAKSYFDWRQFVILIFASNKEIANRKSQIANENNHLAHTVFNLGNNLVFYQSRIGRFAADNFRRRPIHSRRFNSRCHNRHSKNPAAEDRARVETSCADRRSAIFH